MLAEPYYYPGSGKKPLVRGIMHKIGLVVFPWILTCFVPDSWTTCHVSWYTVCFGSILGVLFTSSIYHHWTFSLWKYHLVRKIDMTSVQISILGNMLPCLIVYQMRVDLCLMVTYFLLSQVWLWKSRSPRRVFLASSLVVCLTVTLVTLPRLLLVIYWESVAALVGLVIILVVVFVLYYFAEHENLSKWFSIHDVIHFISLIAFIHCAVYNSFLINEFLCF